MADIVNISVRSLVEYAFRSGSIESGFRTSTTLTEGTKAHQKVQKQYGEQDQKEVYVSTEIAYNDLLFVIDGRCDGLLFSEDDLVTVDEIKSTSGDLSLITEDKHPVHWAQAKCYAYMYAKEHGLSRMRFQLTYVQVESEEQKRFVTEAAYEELEQYALEMVRRYFPFAQARKRHLAARDRSIKELSFPFDTYREGQRKLAGAVYKTIAEGHSLFAKAPTGIGKTISTIFPAVKAMGVGLLQRLFYLTAKTITRTAAEEACAILQAKGPHLHTVTITAKDKVCFQEETRCSKEHCEYADGYYDRINEAILDMLREETMMSRTVIERYARKHRVCPFEFSLDAAYAADAVICDYNYIFDPRVNLKRIFEESKRQTVLLVDEAHNLVDRAREMFSSNLHKADFLAVQRAYKGVHAGIYTAAKTVNDAFIAMRKEIGESKHRVYTHKPQELITLLESFIAHAEGELGSSLQTNPLLLELYFDVQNFVRIAKLYEERHVTCAECFKNDVHIKMFCLDPSHLLQQISKAYRSCVFFSATLFPLTYYMDMLGGGEDAYSVDIPSPFSSGQLQVQIQPLSTRFQDRERSIEPIAANLHRFIERRQGNYLLFFPSYDYMNRVYEIFIAERKLTGTIMQQSNMTEEERERFLAAFDADNQETLVGFAVMGGMFSEGIDLVGDRLNGVAVIGMGLPQLGLERNLIKDYMNAMGKNGYEYAYVFPGMNKVVQAGGRLIRSEKDHGSLLLIDDRYLQPMYQRLLPEEWKDYEVIQAVTPPL